MNKKMASNQMCVTAVCSMAVIIHIFCFASEQVVVEVQGFAWASDEGNGCETELRTYCGMMRGRLGTIGANPPSEHREGEILPLEGTRESCMI